MIQATFEKRPIRHRAFDCEVREVWSDADFSTAVSRIKQTRISHPLSEGEIPGGTLTEELGRFEGRIDFETQPVFMESARRE